MPRLLSMKSTENPGHMNTEYRYINYLYFNKKLIFEKSDFLSALAPRFSILWVVWFFVFARVPHPDL